MDTLEVKEFFKEDGGIECVKCHGEGLTIDHWV